MRPLDERRWESAYAQFHDFRNSHGHGRVPVRYVTGDGFALGKWVANQKTLHRAGALLEHRRAVLDADPEWRWIPEADPWQEGLDHLVAFVSEHDRLPYLVERWNGREVGAWMRTQRRAYREGRMGLDRAAALEGVSRWDWGAA